MAEGTLYIEKRKHKRIEKELSVSYKLVPKDNTTAAMRMEGKSKDLSSGGIRIEGEPIGAQEDVLRLEFMLDGVNIITFAEIKWIREVEGKKQFGIEFLALKNEDKEKIDKLAD